MRTGVSSSNVAKKPSSLWMVELGEIVASPVFSKNVLYVPSMMGKISALNSKDKNLLWQLDIGSPVISSPLIHKDKLIIATFDSWVKNTRYLGKNFVLVVDLLKGRTMWKYEIDGDAFSSPCVYGNTCVIGSLDKNLYAININNGELQWKYRTGCAVWSSPAVNDDTLYWI